jgi:hypothetical protein
MKTFNKRTLVFPLEQTIELNLSLQSTSKKLSQEFKIYKPSLVLFKSKRFLDYFNTWEDKRKKDFILTIGGIKNYKKTKIFLDNLFNTEEKI